MTALDLGFSSCPNDTFIFHALVHGLVDTGGHAFAPRIADVEELNHRALAGEYAVTKLSFHAFLHVRATYELLDAGAALGFGCGPLLVARHGSRDIERLTIAVPGRYTTAAMLLRLWNPGLVNIVHVRFDEVMPGIVDGRWDAGVIIHEGRFVYEQFGLEKIVDLGAWWEETTAMPIPLGCIALRKDTPLSSQDMSDMIRASIEYARDNPRAASQYIASHALELDKGVIDQHIALYVNDFSLSLGEQGRRAVEVLAAMAGERGLV